ncbi:MAG TPA: hypothetical protein VGE00_06955 [Gammaproteobacteria bacterium]
MERKTGELMAGNDNGWVGSLSCAKKVVSLSSRHFRPFVQLARQKAASLKHVLIYPEMTAMLGCVHGIGRPSFGAEKGLPERALVRDEIKRKAA